MEAKKEMSSIFLIKKVLKEKSKMRKNEKWGEINRSEGMRGLVDE